MFYSYTNAVGIVYSSIKSEKGKKVLGKLQLTLFDKVLIPLLNTKIIISFLKKSLFIIRKMLRFNFKICFPPQNKQQFKTKLLINLKKCILD